MHITKEAPTSSVYLLAARTHVAALRSELESTAPAHEADTDWRISCEEELALSEQRLARLEQLETALPC